MLPATAHAKDYVVTFQRPDGAIPFATFHCQEAVPCTGRATVYSLSKPLQVDVLMEVAQSRLQFLSILWTKEDWHFILLRDGGGEFGMGRAAATLELDSVGLVHRPVVRSRQIIERFFVTLADEPLPPL